MRPQRAEVAIKRVVALTNKAAGAFNKDSAERKEKAISSALAAHGLIAEIEFIDGSGLKSAVERAQARAERGEIDAVIVGGGDGSLRTAAGVLAGTGVPLGILPLGTMNHFAKDLGLPLSIQEASVAIAGGQIRAVDIAEVNGEIFINNSSIGIYPYMVIDRERRMARHKLAKWAAMVPAFFRMMWHFPRRRLRIAAPGFERPYRTPCLFVGNNQYAMELFTARRRQRLDSGKLWFYVVKPREPLEFFWMVCRLCFGRFDQKRDVDRFELAEAEVSAKASRLPVALDGEVRLLQSPLRYRSCPGALTVLVL